MFPNITKANPPAAVPEAKQTKLDSGLAVLDDLTIQELKSVTIKTNKIAKNEKKGRNTKHGP